MKVINLSNEEISDLMKESHQEVLKQCEKIEELYNVEVTIKHDRAMEYSMEMKDLYSDLVLLRYGKNIPGKVKNYLKGLIDAHKIELR
ncbi:MAG: hypothetical protein IKL65_00490 [Bacilli bacterium]|nr:hypothetical protein [Bacilli bacterium]MBR6689794.1 hypothetical protein [Bacilli bacterium]